MSCSPPQLCPAPAKHGTAAAWSLDYDPLRAGTQRMLSVLPKCQFHQQICERPAVCPPHPHPDSHSLRPTPTSWRAFPRSLKGLSHVWLQADSRKWPTLSSKGSSVSGSPGQTRRHEAPQKLSPQRLSVQPALPSRTSRNRENLLPICTVQGGVASHVWVLSPGNGASLAVGQNFKSDSILT